MNTLLLIDGNALMHRAYHALPPFKTKAGLPTNAVYGFLSMLHKAIIDFKPSHIAVCFDTPTPTFRKKIFKDYQAQRPKLEDELKQQMPTIREALDKGGIVHFEKPGYEADDLIGTITNQVKNINIKVLIFTGDKDIFQLITDKVFVIAPLVGLANVKLYDRDEAKKRLSVNPNQVIDYKALMGDPADNYPGARGIGPKTAVQLINQFSNIDNLFAHLDKLENNRIKKILEDNKDNVFMAKKLAAIDTNVEINFDPEQTKFGGFKPELKDFLTSLEIESLTNRIYNQKKEPPTETIKNTGQQIGLF